MAWEWFQNVKGWFTKTDEQQVEVVNYKEEYEKLSQIIKESFRIEDEVLKDEGKLKEKFITIRNQSNRWQKVERLVVNSNDLKKKVEKKRLR